VVGFDFPGARIILCADRGPMERMFRAPSGLFLSGTEWEHSVKIADNTFVAIDYRLTLESGEEFDRSAEGSPLGFVTGTGSIIPGLESALSGRSKGESFQVTVEPEEAYGPVQKELIQAIPRDRFPTDVEIEPGMSFHARGPRGPVALTVVSVDREQVNVDLNHPLAGKRLTFEVKVQEVREPLPHEVPVSSGCACGPREQSACGCGPGDSGSSGGCGSGSGGGCACG
jgi:FKBP-type peptidyl-prolyl cis-trans isomerase SlyD